MSDLADRLDRLAHDITRGLEPKEEYIYELCGRAASRLRKLEAVKDVAEAVCKDGTMDGIRAAAILISLDPLESLEQALAACGDES